MARMKRSDSRATREEIASPTLADRLDAPGGDARNASKVSLASSGAYSGEFEPPNPDEINNPIVAASSPPAPAPSNPGPSALGPPPKIPTKNPTRSLKESNASSAFLSVSPAHGPSNATATLPLTSLYLVSGLPKSPQTWTLADQDSTAGVHHSEGSYVLKYHSNRALSYPLCICALGVFSGAVGRFWRAEVLGSSVTPGVGKKKRRGKGVGEDGGSKRLGTLSKSDLGKMLSKALKLSFTREVEIIASTLQPASTVHTFTFTLPTVSDGPSTTSNGILRTSILSTTTAGLGDRGTTSNFPYMDPSYPRPSSTYLGPSAATAGLGGTAFDPTGTPGSEAITPGTTYHGVCLTVWSHADEERTGAIRRTLELAARSLRPSNATTANIGGGSRHHHSSASRMNRKVSGTSSVDTNRNGTGIRSKKKSTPWSTTEASELDTQTDGDVDLDAFSDVEPGLLGGPSGGAPGTTTSLFLPPNTVFWLPYALSESICMRT